MLLWFVGGSWVAVWAVLGDPAVDYRLVIVGALLPDVVDGAFGAPRVGHALVGGVVVLMAVMVLTYGRRGLRRRLLAVPIGIFVHLVLDGMWTDAHVFWWPFQGRALSSGGGLPSMAHPLALGVVEEVAGAVALGWCWRRFRLGEPDRRSRFVRTGRLGRDSASR